MIVAATVVFLPRTCGDVCATFDPPLITAGWMCVWICIVVDVGSRRGKDVAPWRWVITQTTSHAMSTIQGRAAYMLTVDHASPFMESGDYVVVAIKCGYADSRGVAD